MPTDTGTVVNDFLMEYFPNILDYNFTASVEKQFDEIAEGEKKWTAILKDFYKGFHPSVENTLATKNAHKAGERILGEEPGSGKTGIRKNRPFRSRCTNRYCRRQRKATLRPAQERYVH